MANGKAWTESGLCKQYRNEQNRTEQMEDPILSMESNKFGEKNTLFFIEESCIYKGFAVRLQNISM